jgi:DNA-directed RNA polymerase specialized sigma24 family protein
MDDDPAPVSPLCHGLALWVSPVDDDHVLVNPVLIEAAHRHRAKFMAYRAREFPDESLRMQLLEKAVHKVSRAQEGKPIQDAAAILFKSFMRLVNRAIRRSKKLQPLLEYALYGRSDTLDPEELDRLLAWKDACESLNDEDRRLLRNISLGYTNYEIAERMGLKPNTVTKRISRLKKELKNRLDGIPVEGSLSEADGKSRIAQTLAGRHPLPEGGQLPPGLPEPEPSRLPPGRDFGSDSAKPALVRYG